MFWYILMCFATANGPQCMKVETVTAEACNYTLYHMRTFAEQRGIQVELSCMNPNQYA